MRPVLKFFSSVKLAIALIILITLASVLGTLIPQGRTEAEYAARYGALAKPLVTFQLTRLYQSGWYLALLLLFGLNTVVCTLSRLGPKWRRAFGPARAADAQALAAMKVKARFRLDLPAASAQERIAGVLRARGYRSSVASAPAGMALCGPEKASGLVRLRHRPPRAARHPGRRPDQLGRRAALGPGPRRRPDAGRPAGRLQPSPRQIRDGVLPAGRRQGLEEHGLRHRERRSRPDPDRRGQPPPDPSRLLVLPDELRLGLERADADPRSSQARRRLVLEARDPEGGRHRGRRGRRRRSDHRPPVRPRFHHRRGQQGPEPLPGAPQPRGVHRSVEGGGEGLRRLDLRQVPGLRPGPRREQVAGLGGPQGL